MRRHAVEPAPASERVHGLAVVAYRGLAAWLCTPSPSCTGDAAAPRAAALAPTEPLPVDRWFRRSTFCSPCSTCAYGREELPMNFMVSAG